MKKFFWVVFVVSLFFAVKKSSFFEKPYRQTIPAKPASLTESVALSDIEKGLTSVVENALPAVCSVSASWVVEAQQPMYFDDFFFSPFFEDFFGVPKSPKQKFRQEATGSGVIISEDGVVLTNEHVIAEADEVKVTVYSGGKEKTYSAEILGSDRQTDVAVVKIKGGKKFHFLPLGDSDSIKIGELVLAIGSPFGLSQTVTLGIVSAIRQSVQIQDRIYEDVIQTDAAINRGNSGGPLLNVRGEVVGINSAIVAPAGGFVGVGFAIPINRAKAILGDLIEKGSVSRGWLGIEMKAVDEVIKREFHLKDENGVLVTQVLEGSPAEKGGIKRGDVIVEFEGEVVKNMFDLRKKVQSSQPGSLVKIKVIRDGKPLFLSIRLGEAGETVVSEAKFQWEGITVRNLNEEELKITSQGVVVDSLDYSLILGRSGLRVGDIIREINRNEIKDVDSFKNVVGKINPEEGVFFDILRNGIPIYITFIP